MIKDKVQLITIVIGFISFGFFVNTMLQISTVIIPSWFLVLMYTPVLIGISLTLGYFVKNLRETKWKTISFTFLFIAIISLLYVFSQYRRNLRINIPDNYAGTVFLVLSNEPTNDFDINQFGIGYICKETYNSGFRPTVYKKGVDITKTIKGHSNGSGSCLNCSSITYIKFKIPYRNNKSNYRPKEYKQNVDLTKTKNVYNNENSSSVSRNQTPNIKFKTPTGFNGREIGICDLLLNKAINKKRIKLN